MAATTADLIHTHPLVEQILDSHREHALGDERGWASYRGHIYRVLTWPVWSCLTTMTATTSWPSPPPFTTSMCSAR